MSGLDITARGLALRASAGEPATFAQLAARAIPDSVQILRTSGHAASGKGGGSYVADALCTEALAAAHPAFVLRTANGRRFRLMPEHGAIQVEQGGAIGDGIANDQPAIQATLDYAKAVGIGEVAFASHHYRIHAVTRTSPVIDQFATDGHPLVVSASIRLRGIAPRRTVLDFRGRDGADPNTDYQLVPWDASAGAANAVWRGGGLFVRGDVGWNGAPPQLAVDAVELHRLILQGNRSRTSQAGWPSGNWPADPATGDGWDDTDRAFWVQDTHIGDVSLFDTDMHGWRGEIYYGAALSQRSLHIERCSFSHTNGVAFNPGTNCPLVARDCAFGDAFIAHEDTGKAFANYNGCRWYDATSMNLGSGPANGLKYNYLYPTRDENDTPPVTLLDSCRFENVNSVHVGSWVRGKIKTVDSSVLLLTFLFSELRDIELEIDAWLDRKTAIVPVALEGPTNLTTQIGGAPAGTYQREPRNIRLVVRAMLTEMARRQGRYWEAATWSGYVSHEVAMVMEDCLFAQAPIASGTPVSMPLIEMRNFRNEDTPNNPANGARYRGEIVANAQISVVGPALSYSFVGGPHVVTLTATAPGGEAFGYAHGQMLRIYAVSNAANEGEGLLFRRDEPWSAMRLKQDRLLSRSSDYIEFRFNKHYNLWEETDYRTNAVTVLSVTYPAVNVPSVPANRTSVVSVTLAGARAGDHVAVAPSTLPAGMIASARVTATDTVGITFLNASSTTSTAFSASIKVRAER